MLHVGGTVRENDRNLEGFFDAANSKGVKLLIVILPSQDSVLYRQIKVLGDVQCGIHTCCIIGSKVSQPGKSNQQYFANVALKLNLKLGGINQSLSLPEKYGIIKEGKTMLVGIDVTHPSPGSLSGAPSVAGVVASVDKHLGQWPAEIRVQQGRQEMVAALHEMMRNRLVLWRKVNGMLPENIIVYRDGVSEGQYDIALRQELPLIRTACKELYEAEQTRKGIPRLSVLVVGKRHHTRFYPTTKAEATAGGNPRNGTVVERGVTEARNWDFFLQSHHAIQGTARPAHYYVICDEIFRAASTASTASTGRPRGAPADDVIEMTHNLCYMYGRATKAVSICPPAYYADLVCDRARHYLNDVFDPSLEDTPASSVIDGQQPSTHGSRQTRVTIHENLKDTMFYI